VAGVPWVERAPLFYWLAAALAGLGSMLGWSLHDGARLATGFFSALALWGTGLAGRELIGRRHGRSAVLILLGCVGLLLPGHMLSADTAILAGWSWGLYALALAPRVPVFAGGLLAAALALCGLAGSLLEPLLLLAVALSVAGFEAWRRRRYPITLVLALGLALPLVVLWPWMLHRRHPEAFEIWWAHHALGWFGGVATPRFLHDFGSYLGLLPWFAWPAWPLAAATLWMQRDRLLQARFVLPLAASLLVLLALTLAGTTRAGHALLILPPLALIGAVGLDVLRRGASAFLNWFGVITFGLFALFLWTCWSAMHLGWPTTLAGRITALAPAFHASWRPVAFVVGIGLTLAWIWAVSRRRPLGRQAVTNWAAGITLCWGLTIAFASPWVDARNGYAHFAAQMKPLLPQGCIAGEGLGDSQRAMLHYYLGIRTLPRATGAHCEALLVQTPQSAPTARAGWHLVWEGGRAGDPRERFRLYQRASGTAEVSARASVQAGDTGDGH
jgi:4-amino-4-deoxy-L-arabinose transferase-like glycosyltransferase